MKDKHLKDLEAAATLLHWSFQELQKKITMLKYLFEMLKGPKVGKKIPAIRSKNLSFFAEHLKRVSKNYDISLRFRWQQVGLKSLLTSYHCDFLPPAPLIDTYT